MGNVILKLNNVTIRIGDRHILKNTSWTVRENEHWAVVGPNGSGKTSLARALVDEYFIVKGTTYRDKQLKKPNSAGYVSFEQQQDLYEYSERKQHAFSFSGKSQEIITPGYIISADTPLQAHPEIIDETAELLGIRQLLHHPMISLSNGEVRKVLIARALVKQPSLLVLDEPFEGLDLYSRKVLEKTINQVIASGSCQVILVTHRFDHLPSAITHLLCLKAGSAVISGDKNDVLASRVFKDLYRRDDILDKRAVPQLFNPAGDTPTPNPAGPSPLISMKNVDVVFGETAVLRNFSWDVFKGENWILTGPNGAGKSTILRLIFGDLSQVYANNITLLGHRRGTGESLWDIRKAIGFLSPEFHMNYRKTVSILEVIISGFYDSIGLFRSPFSEHVAAARKWLMVLGFSEREHQELEYFSFGEQRLILLARALVKTPLLLVLDEPLQGLDPENRKLVLEMIELYGTSNSGTIIYITHHAEEIGSCFTHKMEISRSHEGFHFLASHLKLN